MQALDSLPDVERALRAEGFFVGGAEGLVADVFVGCVLSRALRRTGAPDPPEPCPLPAAALRIRPADEPRPAAAAFEVGDWELSWPDEGYVGAIEAVRAA